ncbi:Glutaconate CoA-transferase subunit B [compost metagenome]
MMDLGRKSFVENVDFITSVGHFANGQTREQLGAAPGGPALVITDKAIFDFNPVTHRMRLRSLHPEVELQQVLDNMAFMPEVPAQIATTKAPGARELELIRSSIDPNTTFLIA